MEERELSMLKKFVANQLGKDYVVGDIHGCFARLSSRLLEIGFNESTDRLFAVGDLVDRGPDSEDCQEWLAKPWFHSVRGNHEQMAIDFAQGYGDPGNYAYNGGAWFISLTKPERTFFADLFKALPLAIEVETPNGLVGIVHAECPTADWSSFVSRLAEQDVENCALWARDRYRMRNKSEITGVRAVFSGHTPIKTPITLGNVHMIDTGAVFGGAMTIYDICTLQEA